MRYKEFNAKKVLEDCISLFWDRGFGSCAIKDIVSATTVNRFSLYEEFENKEGILLASIDLYETRYSQPKFELLKKEGDLKEVLYSFFMSFLKDDEFHPSGCYIIRIATELADSNRDVKDKLNNYINSLEKQFVEILSKYSETSDSATYLSKHLVGLFCSLTTFCVIHSFNERKSLVNSGIAMLLKNHLYHATHA